MRSLEAIPRRLYQGLNYTCCQCKAAQAFSRRSIPLQTAFPVRIRSPSRRAYSSSTIPSSGGSIPSRGFVRLSDRRLILLHGHDSAKFLQGLITRDVFKLTGPGSSGFYAASLSAQGRVLFDFFVYPCIRNESEISSYPGSAAEIKGSEGFLIDVEASAAAMLRSYIKRHVLRSKVKDVLLKEDELQVWSVWDETRPDDEPWTGYTFGEGQTRASSTGREVDSTPLAQLGEKGSINYISCSDSRAPGMGKRLILPGGSKPDFDAEEYDEEIYRARRYIKGIAEGENEIIRGTALPQESNIDYMGAIDYRKGCYVGQELTIRTHHQGVVRKRILPVQLYEMGGEPPEKLEYISSSSLSHGESTPAPLSNVWVEGSKRPAGKWLNACGNIGLALCRLDTVLDPKSKSSVRWGTEGQEKEMGIKAFVPSWHLDR